MTSPTVGEDLLAALDRISRVPHLLVALDFDGTVAPLVDRPEDARAIPESRDAIHRLADLPGTTVAFISGRALDSLIAVAEPPENALLSGSHGVETRIAGDIAVTLTHPETTALARLREILDGVASQNENTWIEVKPAGYALHYRAATAEVARAAVTAAQDAVIAELPSVTQRHGNNVLEFSIRSTTKGDAIQLLREHTEASAVFFAGDDVTDEDGFRALTRDDIGLKCGPGVTAARYAVSDPLSVAQALGFLAELREKNMPQME